MTLLLPDGRYRLRALAGEVTPAQLREWLGGEPYRVSAWQHGVPLGRVYVARSAPTAQLNVAGSRSVGLGEPVRGVIVVLTPTRPAIARPLD